MNEQAPIEISVLAKNHQISKSDLKIGMVVYYAGSHGTIPAVVQSAVDFKENVDITYDVKGEVKFTQVPIRYIWTQEQMQKILAVHEKGTKFVRVLKRFKHRKKGL